MRSALRLTIELSIRAIAENAFGCMETDKIYYQILLLFPSLVPEIAQVDPATRFTFSAPVVKALEKRVDGLLLPDSNDPAQPIVFVEAQMQPDPGLYRRMLNQLGSYLHQYNEARPWKAVVIYPDRQTERLAQPQVMAALNLTRIYLNETEEQDSEGWDCLRLIGIDREQVPDRAASLVSRVRANDELGSSRLEVIQLITSIVARRFPELSDKEIRRMVNLVPLEQTRSYQEGRQEGQEEKARAIARNLLRRGMSSEEVAQITGLTAEEIQSLARLT